ncbi:hypothetical protein [Lysobacter sp. GCM10012299]|uniref:hypothetical protein n=1 Tax=Lysobacter sp. GCM10012299 TaxID=3317333 RepID=UPI0036144827
MPANALRITKLAKAVSKPRRGYESCILDLKVVVGHRYRNHGEPGQYVLSYEGRLLSGPDYATPIGAMSMYIADLEAAVDAGVSPFDVLDGVDSSLAHFCELLTTRTGWFRPALERFTGVEVCRLFVLGTLNIEQPYRGHGLGLQAIRLACDGVGQGCELAALKAFPIQWEGRVDEGPTKFARDRAKLVRYYQRAGFKPIIGEGLMVSALPLNSTVRYPYEEA